jgi:uncharacterized lipoprotein
MKLYIVLALGLIGLLSACNGKTEYDYPIETKERRQQAIGSIVSEDKEGGISIFGNKNKNAANNLNVNQYLWKAALEVISFMPLAQSDPIGGVILTDWYADAKAPKDRFKMNLVISSGELQVSAIKVTVFKQTQDASGNWQSAIASEKVGRELEDKIINRARQLKIGQPIS